MLVAKVIGTAAAGLPDSVTANDMLIPSATDTSSTDNVAASLALIVPVPVPSEMLMPAGKPPAGADSVTVNVSAPSARMSSVAATVNVCIRSLPVAPDEKVRLLLVLVKSA